MLPKEKALHDIFQWEVFKKDKVYSYHLEPSDKYVPPKRRARALALSIKKWESIVALLEKMLDEFDFDNCILDVHDGGTSTCSLCKLYYWKDRSCTGCPVFLETTFRYCETTGYDTWSEYMDYADCIESKRSCEIFLDIAKKELDFLKGLREV